MEILEVDGSYGSGGGQILRTAVGLAALTGNAIKIYNIRQKRENPGIQEQHLQAVNAVAQLCQAELKGAFKGSKELEFYPSKLQEGKLDVKISTAGSIGLVLQALMIPAYQLNLDVNIQGGATYGKWAPPIEYTNNVLKYFLSKIGYKFNISIERDGFYPKGGAAARIKISKASKLEKLIAIEKGKLETIKGISVASLHLKNAKVAERQAEKAKQILYDYFKVRPEISAKYVDTYSAGSGITIWAECKNTVVGADALGERGKSSEKVGEEAAEKLIKEYKAGTVDRHATDQLLPYLALAGGKILTSEITDHAKTNIWLIEQFLPVKFKVKGNLIEVEK